MRRNERLYLQDKLERILHIESCTAYGREAFLSDRLLQDGVILAFMVNNLRQLADAVDRILAEG